MEGFLDFLNQMSHLGTFLVFAGQLVQDLFCGFVVSPETLSVQAQSPLALQDGLHIFDKDGETLL